MSIRNRIVARQRRLASSPRRRTLFLENLECRRVLTGGEIVLGGGAFLPDQPYVDIELRDGDTVIGPTGSGFEIYPYNHLLLDTGANGIIAVSDAVTDMEQLGYQTEGSYEEIGVSGTQYFDVSAAYELGFSGSDGVVHTLTQTADDVRILSNPDMAFNGPAEFGGIPGLVGMPAMVNRVTTLDMSAWNDVTDLLELTPMGVGFSNSVPIDSGHRYSVPVDTRILFDPRDGLPEGSPPDAPLPTWAPIPFLDVSPGHQGSSATGSFLLDTGAQLSIMASSIAFDLGLDESGDGSFLDEAISTIDVIGVGGVVEIPVLLIDEISIMTEQGVRLTWGGADDVFIEMAIHDIAPGSGINGILGCDLLTGGLTVAYDDVTGEIVFGDGPYFNQIHMDFRDLATQGTGTLFFDVNPIFDTVVPGNQAPALTLNGGAAYTENQPAVMLASPATLSDVDSPNFDTGRLSVTIAANASSADRLSILPGNGISASSGVVSYNGVPIGTATGGVGSIALEVVFDDDATVEAVQTLIRQIGFRNTSNDPSTWQRMVEFRVSDGDGGESNVATVTVDVTALNDAPLLNTLLSPTLLPINEDLTTSAGTAVRSLLAGAVSDADGSDSLRGIAVTAATGPTQSSWEYSLDGGASWSPLAVASGDAVLLPADTQTRVRFVPNLNFYGEVQIDYRAWDQTFGDAGETVTLSEPGVVGGTGAVSVSTENASLTVMPINDRPLITNFGDDIAWQEKAAPAIITSTALVGDVDSTNFDGGQLTVTITTNAQAADRLAIRTGPVVSTIGDQVFYDDSVSKKVIGTFTPGGGSTPLVVTWNSDATAGKIRAVLRSITFFHDSVTPSANTRRVRAQLSDGDGANSLSVAKMIAVTPVNDAPLLTGSSTVSYGLNAASGVAPSSTFTLTDPDTPRLTGGTLRVAISSGIDAGNRLWIGGGFTVLEGEIRWNGTLIGTLNTNGGIGTTALVVSLTENATAPFVQTLIRSIRFRTVNSSLMEPRTLLYRVSDGSLWSGLATSTVNITN